MFKVEKYILKYLTFAYSTIASAPFQIAKAIEGLGRGVMDAELNDRNSFCILQYKENILL
jgi:hypothetical protein